MRPLRVRLRQSAGGAFVASESLLTAPVVQVVSAPQGRDGRFMKGTETETFLLRCRFSPSLSALWLNYTPEMELLRFMSPAFTYYTRSRKKGGKGHKVSVMLRLVRDQAVWAIAHCHCPPLSLDPPSTCCKEGQPYQGSHRCSNI